MRKYYCSYAIAFLCTVPLICGAPVVGTPLPASGDPTKSNSISLDKIQAIIGQIQKAAPLDTKAMVDTLGDVSVVGHTAIYYGVGWTPVDSDSPGIIGDDSTDEFKQVKDGLQIDIKFHVRDETDVQSMIDTVTYTITPAHGKKFAFSTFDWMKSCNQGTAPTSFSLFVTPKSNVHYSDEVSDLIGADDLLLGTGPYGVTDGGTTPEDSQYCVAVTGFVDIHGALVFGGKKFDSENARYIQTASTVKPFAVLQKSLSSSPPIAIVVHFVKNDEIGNQSVRPSWCHYKAFQVLGGDDLAKCMAAVDQFLGTWQGSDSFGHSVSLSISRSNDTLTVKTSCPGGNLNQAAIGTIMGNSPDFVAIEGYFGEWKFNINPDQSGLLLRLGDNLSESIYFSKTTDSGTAGGQQ